MPVFIIELTFLQVVSHISVLQKNKEISGDLEIRMNHKLLLSESFVILQFESQIQRSHDSQSCQWSLLLVS